MTLHVDDVRFEIHKLVVGPYDNNVFVLRCKETGDAVLLDAANEHEKLLELAERLGVRRVLETHGHWDHIQAIPAMREAGYEVAVTELDAPRLGDLGYDVFLDDAEVIEVAGSGCTPSTRPATPRARSASGRGRAGAVQRRHAVPRRPRQHHVHGGDFPRSSSRSRTELFTLPADTMVLPGPRRRHHDRHRASPPAGVDRPGLVAPTVHGHAHHRQSRLRRARHVPSSRRAPGRAPVKGDVIAAGPGHPV